MFLYVLPSQDAVSQTAVAPLALTNGAPAVKAAALAHPAGPGPGQEDAKPSPVLIPAANVRPSKLLTRE
ncbi:MAG: hypothetical protein WA791_06950, partial [Rhodomicrobium sp.]